MALLKLDEMAAVLHEVKTLVIGALSFIDAKSSLKDFDEENIKFINTFINTHQDNRLRWVEFKNNTTEYDRNHKIFRFSIRISFTEDNESLTADCILNTF